MVLVEEEGKKSYPFVPDVSVTTERRKKPSRKKGGTAVAEPVLGDEPVLMRPSSRRSIARSSSRSTRRLPSSGWSRASRFVTLQQTPNTPGYDVYLRKRQSLMLGGPTWWSLTCSAAVAAHARSVAR